jgi:plastocyanin
MLRLLRRAAPLGLVLVLASAQGAMASTVNVSIKNLAFNPATITMIPGTTVHWSNDETTTSHTVTSDGIDPCCPNGPALFQSGTLSPGQTFDFMIVTGGQYKYHCSIHTFMHGTINVRIRAFPATGGLTTVFTITWAHGGPVPAGYNEDVQIKRPGGTFVDWKLDQTGSSATFTPDGGTGTYSFKARLQKGTSTSLVSGYSPVASITVS